MKFSSSKQLVLDWIKGEESDFYHRIEIGRISVERIIEVRKWCIYIKDTIDSNSCSWYKSIR